LSTTRPPSSLFCLGSGPRLALISCVSLVGALWLSWKGPVPVLRGTTALPEVTPFWYMEAAFPILGMLLADLVDEAMAGMFRRRTLALVSQIALLILVSNMRLDARIPVSGHAALIAFFIWRRIGSRTPANLFGRVEIAAAAAALLVVASVKVFWWHDTVSLVLGMGAGLLIAVPDSGVVRLGRGRHSLTRFEGDAATPANPESNRIC